MISAALMLLIFISCNKDDDQESRPGELVFSGFSEHELLLYVGGEQRDPSGIILSRLFNETRRSWISNSRYKGQYYYFDSDTVEIHVGSYPNDRYAYLFENDTLYTFHPSYLNFPNPGYWKNYTASGDYTSLYNRQCLTYTKTYTANGTVRRSSTFNVSAHETHESMIGYAGYYGLDQMGPNDTLLLINQTRWYK
jgi:hypothetical protein